MSDYACPPSPQTYTRSITRPRARINTLFSCLAGTTRAWLHVHGACARMRSVWQPRITQTGGYQSLPYSFNYDPKNSVTMQLSLVPERSVMRPAYSSHSRSVVFFFPTSICLHPSYAWVGGGWGLGWFHTGRIIPYIGHLSKSIKNNYWLSSSHFIPYRLGKRTYF